MPLENLSELNKCLEDIVKRLKTLKRKKGRIKKEYVCNAKNPLMGCAKLFGKDAVKRLGKPETVKDLLLRLKIWF